MILLLALPWAIFSSGMEWFVLVPLFPFWQPLFTLLQPYWIGLLVHASSALMYPFFARLRWARDAAAARDLRFTEAWLAGALALMVMLGIVAVFGSHGYEPPWIGRNKDADQTYMRHMTTHHAQVSSSRALPPGVRKLDTCKNSRCSWWQARPARTDSLQIGG
ncbi:hypothetical protein [Bradyrhizobium sp. CB2312]|uniref:hypothetical protein n=1 Tax=Bradyrhizobium sp. CB2312 TaxID=3039155 RepID=UPI0024B26F3D|nr:hypothetical protein [Bradyrhizobium sp. CB2312]WFU77255.1 hypothetical protein QA642_13810 [Bradyrhizobium sp. CB2312]